MHRDPAPFSTPSHKDCVSVMLSYSQTRDIPDKDGRTAVMWATERGHYNVVKALIEHKVDVTIQDVEEATGKCLVSPPLDGAWTISILFQVTAYVERLAGIKNKKYI